MIEIKKKDKCCGCYGCANICSKACISMKVDNEGFWYPNVDIYKCINCDLCVNVCPVINSMKNNNVEIKAFACKNTDENVRFKSSSGGVFSLLCEYVIKLGGVVFGASYDENFDVRHTFAKKLEECEQFRGSKYVQSKIGDTYKQAKKFLEEGKIVLFSGTQCQIKGLNLYLIKKYVNLITVDVVCHGVPSPKVFKKYKDSLITRYNGEIKDIRFRDKGKGWREFSFISEFDNGKVYSKTLKEDIYMKGFLSDLYLRPSCYSCTAKNYRSGSDLSLADYWGVEHIHPEFYDDKGVSLITINSQKGLEIFRIISNNMEILETDLDYVISHNPALIKSVKYNRKRVKFFKEIEKRKFEDALTITLKCSTFKKIKNKINYEILKIINNSK